MSKDDSVLYETWLGRERKHVSLTKHDYELWKQKILAEDELMSKIHRVYSGEIPMIDLDEGEAGIFPGRIFPFNAEISSKLDRADPGAKQAIAGSMQSEILKDLGFHWKS